MRSWRYSTADVFTDCRFGGNPLAVFADGRGLSDAEMLSITREMSYSETVFVLPPDDAANNCRLRIFTPGGELPFAGHPTVGTAIVLAETGVITLAGEETHVVFEEGVGPVPVSIRRDARGLLVAELTAAIAPEQLDGAPSIEAVAATLSLAADDIEGPVEIWSCGVPYTIVKVRDRATMTRVRLDRGAWQENLAGTAAPEVYVYCNEPETSGADRRVRMFAPLMGVEEDPATGSAAAAFAGLLGRGLPDGEHRWLLEQGIEMGRPSLLRVTAKIVGGRTTEARVAGNAVLLCQGTMRVR